MSDSDQLILFIGKGPSYSQAQAGEYRKAKYFLTDRPEETHETRFVAEALVELRREEFDRIHVLGTSDAMWGLLLARTGFDADDAAISALEQLKEEDPDALPEVLRDQIREGASDHLGADVEPHLIPVGTDSEEYWQILSRLASLDLESGQVSVDLTHSLRSHPVFLLLTLAYFRAIRDDLTLGSVYYGAYVLAQEHFGGKSPIFDLQPMVELLDWIDAAQAFDRYGDATPLATLLRESEAGLGDLAKRAEYVSRVLQLNTLSKVRANTEQLGSLLEDLPENSPLPLRLIRPRLKRLPERLEGHSQWKATLVAAEEHWNSYRAGPAVVATWEAVIERLGAAYGVDVEEYRNHKALGSLATTWEGWNRGGSLSGFADHASTLKDYRNAIAHTRQGQEEEVQPDAVYRDFPSVLEYFQSALQHEALSRLPSAVSLRKFSDD
ncbi:CRISPR-associated Csx2 family protein [Salinibacter ruber]|uniref:TIGR02221 family CRISPR-associated protein n=1 Tax=Salinibacter ruber TaxID=146919 RepID=UPI002168439D|nr:TIGR02221 family CRISPR-associated protein [Salinibacter ruber]MCS4169357.1 CRISPR-associated Csx2 family protein [Salinibacter ruber]